MSRRRALHTIIAWERPRELAERAPGHAATNGRGSTQRTRRTAGGRARERESTARNSLSQKDARAASGQHRNPMRRRAASPPDKPAPYQAHLFQRLLKNGHPNQLMDRAGARNYQGCNSRYAGIWFLPGADAIFRRLASRSRRREHTFYFLPYPFYKNCDANVRPYAVSSFCDLCEGGTAIDPPCGIE